MVEFGKTKEENKRRLCTCNFSVFFKMTKVLRLSYPDEFTILLILTNNLLVSKLTIPISDRRISQNQMRILWDSLYMFSTLIQSETC